MFNTDISFIHSIICIIPALLEMRIIKPLTSPIINVSAEICSNLWWILKAEKSKYNQNIDCVEIIID